MQEHKHHVSIQRANRQVPPEHDILIQTCEQRPSPSGRLLMVQSQHKESDYLTYHIATPKALLAVAKFPKIMALPEVFFCSSNDLSTANIKWVVLTTSSAHQLASTHKNVRPSTNL